jgi:hypothetical protein
MTLRIDLAPFWLTVGGKLTKVSTQAALGSPGPKLEFREIEPFFWIVVCPIHIPAVNNLGLLRMEFQLAPGQPPDHGGFQPEGLTLTLAMHDDVIGITLEGNARIMPIAFPIFSCGLRLYLGRYFCCSVP